MQRHIIYAASSAPFAIYYLSYPISIIVPLEIAFVGKVVAYDKQRAINESIWLNFEGIFILSKAMHCFASAPVAAAAGAATICN